MTRKTVSNSDIGTADLVGGNDWDSLIADFAIGGPLGTYTVVQDGSTFYVKDKAQERIHSGSDAKVEIQWTIDNIPSQGGTIRLAPNSTFDLGSAAANGLTITETKPKRVNFLGSGPSSIILYTGTGDAIRVINGADSSSQIRYEIGNFTLSGVTDPFNSTSTTVTSGRHGLNIYRTFGNAAFDIHHIIYRNFDIGINVDSTEFNSIRNIRGTDCNIGIKLVGTTGQNTISGNHITDFVLSGMNDTGILYGGGTAGAESLYIGRGAINVMPRMITIESTTSQIFNPTIEDIYFETTSPASEATYGGETLSCIWLKGGSSSPIDQVVLRNLRMGGVENSDYAIQIEYANRVSIDSCVAKGFRKALVYINSNSAGDTRLIIKNPRLRAYPSGFTNTPTPWLIDVPSDGYLTTVGAKLAGSVEEAGRTGIIVNVSSTGLIEGDVVILTGADATYATTTTADSAAPAAIMYPNSAANRPAVIAISGRTPVLVNAATVLNDTLTTSTTTKKAGVNNSMIDSKFVVGCAMEAIGGTGLCWSSVGK